MEGKKPFKSNFKENPENRFDTEMRLRAIEGGVPSHNTKMADEERAGVLNYDESIVSDYIRNRIEAPKDITDGRGVLKVETVEQKESDYEKDFKKLQSLTRKQLDELLTEVETKSREGKGLFSKGNLLSGYAIDRETLESLQSQHHDSVGIELANNIAEKLWNSGDLNANADIIRKKIVSGFVYLEVPGFKTPIVKLYLGLKEMGNLVPKQDVEKIARHLKNERKLLPITSDFKIL